MCFRILDGLNNLSNMSGARRLRIRACNKWHLNSPEPLQHTPSLGHFLTVLNLLESESMAPIPQQLHAACQGHQSAEWLRTKAELVPALGDLSIHACRRSLEH